ncbi:MAG: adenylyltransferase/cytidyltransferase family protein [Candidatus Woykebacteria bacterium]
MRRVMVFGTYDILHKGHLNFFGQAKKLGDYLIVVVARDRFVKQAKNSPPTFDEKKRARNLRRASVANKVILGSKTHNFFQTIRTYRPDLLALGYDQKPKIPKLKKDLKKHRMDGLKIVRLRPFKPKVYKSSLIKDIQN